MKINKCPVYQRQKFVPRCDTLLRIIPVVKRIENVKAGRIVSGCETERRRQLAECLSRFIIGGGRWVRLSVISSKLLFAVGSKRQSAWLTGRRGARVARGVLLPRSHSTSPFSAPLLNYSAGRKQLYFFDQRETLIAPRQDIWPWFRGNTIEHAGAKVPRDNSGERLRDAPYITCTNLNA